MLNLAPSRRPSEGPLNQAPSPAPSPIDPTAGMPVVKSELSETATSSRPLPNLNDVQVALGILAPRGIVGTTGRWLAGSFAKRIPDSDISKNWVAEQVAAIETLGRLPTSKGDEVLKSLRANQIEEISAHANLVLAERDPESKKLLLSWLNEPKGVHKYLDKVVNFHLLGAKDPEILKGVERALLNTNLNSIVLSKVGAIAQARILNENGGAMLEFATLVLSFEPRRMSSDVHRRLRLQIDFAMEALNHPQILNGVGSEYDSMRFAIRKVAAAATANSPRGLKAYRLTAQISTPPVPPLA